MKCLLIIFTVMLCVIASIPAHAQSEKPAVTNPQTAATTKPGEPPSSIIEVTPEESLAFGALFMGAKTKRAQEEAARAGAVLLERQSDDKLEEIVIKKKINLNLYQARYLDDGRLVFVLKVAPKPPEQTPPAPTPKP